MNPLRRFATLALMAVLGNVVLVACSPPVAAPASVATTLPAATVPAAGAAPASPPGTPAVGPTGGRPLSSCKKGDVPKFTGPWADEFTAAYQEATTDMQRRVLCDGTITAQEMAELQDAFGECLEGAGFTGVNFRSDGGFGFTIPKGVTDEQQKATVTRCEGPTIGTLDLLYNGMRQRPDNQPIGEAMAQCMVRMGIVPAGYSSADYVRDSMAGKFSGDPKFSACIRDPQNARP